ILALLATVALATLLPADGAAATWVGYIATAAVVVLFFVHGVRLPRENLVAALLHWRLHLLILATTFAFFPLVGAAMAKALPALLPASLWAGVLFLCALPSTVQTSIAYTSIAKGNVAASVASAAASNLLGIALTPLLAGLLLHTQGGQVPLSGIWKVVLQLLLPFVVGHALRPLLASWAAKQRKLLTYSDRLTVLLSVYSAFSAAVIGGIWSQVPLSTLLILALVCAALLGAALLFTHYGARAAGLSVGDGRAMLHCGALKSLVSGVPMARVLFPSAEIGAIILPVMIYHQLQLMVCATIARRQGAKQAG
ncbi:MAG TPA: bile acid:sodium symporter family protein, partial [Steroidobacteraceae bacterium]|nr:bile acid:sodium symporter family protein [Steroidobacteraceae bacterium]